MGVKAMRFRWLYAAGLVALLAITAVTAYYVGRTRGGVDNVHDGAEPVTTAGGKAERWLSVRMGSDPAAVDGVRAAPRSLVFLRVEWSVNERINRQAFLEAASELASKHPGLGIQFFMLDEEAQSCQEWLASLKTSDDLPTVPFGFPIGAGSVLWLEGGRLRRFDLGGLKAHELVGLSLSMWGGGDSLPPNTPSPAP